MGNRPHAPVASRRQLEDWKSAGLLKLSFMRPKIAAIEPSLVVYRVGKLSDRDDDNDFSRIGQAMGELSEAPIFIDDSASCSIIIPYLSTVLYTRSITLISHDHMTLFITS